MIIPASCNAIADVSSTHPVNFIEMSCFVLVYHDISKNKWKTLLSSAAKMANMPKKKKKKKKKTQNNRSTHALLNLITDKWLFVFDMRFEWQKL